MSPYVAWRERATWLEWLAACVLAAANQEAYNRLPRNLYFAAERELSRMTTEWFIDRWDL